MIYQSLKQTIVQYDEKKSKSVPLNEKLIFRWKVIALALCILTICCIGFLTQIVKEFKNQQALKYNTTFLPSLLQASNQLKTIQQIKYLMNGLNTSQKVKYQQTLKIRQFNQMSSNQLLDQINLKPNVLFIMHLKNEQQTKFKFGMLLRQPFNYKGYQQDNVIYIQDFQDDKNSVIFNLKDNKFALKMNIDQSCKLYTYNETNKQLIILESLHINQQKSNSIQINIKNNKCFSQNQKDLIENFQKLTGIQLNSLDQISQLEIVNIEIFQLNQIKQKFLQF